MDVYKTEEEQLESLKRWMRDNGRSVLTGLLIAVLVVVAGYSWKQRQQRDQETASMEYQNLIDAVRQLDQQPTKEMTATAHHLADQLKTEFPNTTYAQFAALYKARLAVQDNDLKQAEAELRWVLEHKPSADVAALTNLRLARVLHAKKDDDAALALLDEKNAKGYAFSYAQLRGDIHLARGDVAAARADYQHAQELERTLQTPINDPLLEMKLRDLQTAPAASPSQQQSQPEQNAPAKQES